MKNLFNATAYLSWEASGSKNTRDDQSCTKRQRCERNISSSSSKRVIALLPSGLWAAQVYVNGKRVWVGTFKTDKEAEMAYESASIKIWNEIPSRNFPRTSSAVQEPNFLIQSSAEAVQPAINDGSYSFSSANNLKPKSQFWESEVGLNPWEAYATHEVLHKRLFEKVLSASDVGWLNRVVIPKVHACYFPCLSVSAEGNNSSAELCDVELTFYDRSMTSWKFKYSYWKSSGSYVFTRGWVKFVREKQLCANDKIIFFKCQHIDARGVVHAYFMIDVDYHANRVPVEYVHNNMGKHDPGKEEVQNHDNEHNSGGIGHIRPEKNVEADKNMEKPESMKAPEKSIKLFGVQIARG